MPSKIWEKYKFIKEFESNSNSNIKTYLAKTELIVKEILPKNEDDYYKISEKLKKLKIDSKEEFNIYDIKEEDERIYVAIENKKELLLKFDKLILSEELNINKQSIIKYQPRPIKFEELYNILKMGNSMCKIYVEKLKETIGQGSGFFCEIENFPIKYALFTNNHVLDEKNIETGKTIHFECVEFDKSLLSYSHKIIKKTIKITDERKVFTNKELDYTCIQLFESDNVLNYFKINPKFLECDKNNLKDNDIFILQFPKGNDLSFSYGKISSIKDNKIEYNASTDYGSSGSPIIKRSLENNIIGLHCAGIQKNKKEFIYNVGNLFDSILNNIKEQNNEINCIYNVDPNKDEIYLLNDYSLDVSKWYEKSKTKYLEAKSINKKIFEENIELYVDNKKIKFNFRYKIKDSREIKVKFKFKKVLTNTSFMFYNCSNLKKIDFSSFISRKVNDMNNMFAWCSSLKSIDLSSFNTNNVKDMSDMFYKCELLDLIDLSSFNTNNVNNMSCMFDYCSSLKSIDLSSFNTNNVKDMGSMFYSCSSLKSIDLSSFKTNNVNNMSNMFHGCSSLKSIDLSSFKTNNVNNMNGIFYGCSSLTSIDLTSFNTTNINNMNYMFYGCTSLKKKNIRIKNGSDKILKEIENI